MQRKDKISSMIWRIAYPLMMFLGVEIVVEIIMLSIYVVSLISSGALTNMSDVDAISTGMLEYVENNIIYISILRGVILIPLYLMLMNFDKKRRIRMNIHHTYTKYSKVYLLVLPFAGIVAALGFNNLVVLSGAMEISNTYDEVASQIYNKNVFTTILSAVVIAPLLEEFLFRGVLYRRMRDSISIIPSMLLSAIIFGLIHGNLVQFIYAFFIGILLAYVFEKFKTIWAPVIFHGAANLFSVLVTYYGGNLDFLGNMSLGVFMLVTEIELAITCLLLLIIEKKVKREVE